MVWWSPPVTSLSKTASSWTAGVMAVDYSGAKSKRILRTIYYCIPHASPNRPAMPGPRRGEKTRSTPLGCRTTATPKNGSGNRWCDKRIEYDRRKIASYGIQSASLQSVSVSVALLLAKFGSVTPLGTMILAVSEREPVAEALIVPVAL